MKTVKLEKRVYKYPAKRFKIPEVRCQLCGIGIGSTMYGDEEFKHTYSTAHILPYKDINIILDADCLEYVRKRRHVLKDFYNRYQRYMVKHSVTPHPVLLMPDDD